MERNLHSGEKKNVKEMAKQIIHTHTHARTHIMQGYGDMVICVRYLPLETERERKKE